MISTGRLLFDALFFYSLSAAVRGEMMGNYFSDAVEENPIIAGGLISDKESVMAALSAGAIAVSTTNHDVRKL